MGGLDLSGDLSALTSTSGLSYKISGRVGDTPIIGGGIYVDNAVGSAGATGRGEAVMQSCGGFHAVSRMESGDTPEAACLHVLRLIAERAESRLRDAQGRPTFNVTMYAIRKDGLLGAASIHPGYEFTCFDGTTVRTLKASSVYPE
jgi:N4-(beta-N-acetylglucosaminyl)-L-asparaginase